MFLKKIKNSAKQLLKSNKEFKNNRYLENKKKHVFELDEKQIKSRSKVFCIGANKTGTTSLELTLKEFGFCFGNQREAVLTYVKNINRWQDAISLYCDRYDAFQDVPFSLGDNYIHLDKLFPGSKFILTVRDSPEQWYQSLIKFHSKVFNCCNVPPKPNEIENNYHLEDISLLDFICKTFGTSRDDPYNEHILIDHYNTRNQKILDYFKDRPEDLLVINLSNRCDYTRLRHFLFATTQRTDFPHENKTENNGKCLNEQKKDVTNGNYTTEVIVPISVTQGFINQIKLAYYSLKVRGFLDRGFRLNIVYAGDERKELAAKFDKDQFFEDLGENHLERKFINWTRLNQHIRTFKVSNEFINAQYPSAFSHCNYRYHLPLSADCKAVILCDADTIFLDLFEPTELLGENELVIAGHMVHFPPPIFSNETKTLVTSDSNFWPNLFDKLGLDKKNIKHRCSISNRESGLQAPNYNFGFVLVTPQMLKLFSWHYNSYLAKVQSVYRTPMASQITITAIGIDFGATFINLSGHYNAANDEEHWRLNNLDSTSIKVLHYLREDEFYRETFLNPENIDGFLTYPTKIRGNKLLKEQVKHIINIYGKSVFL